MAILGFLGAAISAIILFWRKSIIFLDPDFGWQLRTGEYILQYGFPKTDPFSYTMPEFPFVAHSWLIDVLFAQIYPVVGYEGLAILTSTASVLALCVALLPNRKHLPSILLAFLLSVSSLLSYISVRPQSFSWLLFAFFIIIIFEKKLWQKFGWVLPLVMILWVNIHGSFAIGLGILGFKLGYKALMQKKLDKKLALISLATFAATFINPYTYDIWREVFLTFFDNKLRTEISEWKPLFLRLSEFHIPIMAISLVFVIKQYRKLDKSFAILFLLLLFVAFSSSKLLPFWIVAAAYVTPIAINSFKKDLPNKLARKRFSFVINLLIVLAASALILHIPRIWKSYTYFSEENFYSDSAVKFIKKDLPNRNENENIFTPFIWGGYTLWKIPEKKVFIDGRMTYWTDDKAPSTYSTDAFVDQARIVTLEPGYERIIEKYSIGTILVPKTSLDPNFKTFAEELEETGWEKTFEDENALIYQKP